MGSKPSWTYSDDAEIHALPLWVHIGSGVVFGIALMGGVAALIVWLVGLRMCI